MKRTILLLLVAILSAMNVAKADSYMAQAGTYTKYIKEVAVSGSSDEKAAINYLENQGIQKKLYYVKAMSFQDEFLQSVMKRTLMDFMKKYSELDLLFLDDFQMFSNKQTLQEQLEYILVILDLYGKSVVIASEKPIDELSGISERLKKRIKT